MRSSESIGMKSMWLGVVFFVALGLLAIGTVGVGHIPVLKTTKPLDVGFSNLQGLRVGDDVHVERTRGAPPAREIRKWLCCRGVHSRP